MTQHYRLGGTQGERRSVARAEALRDVRCSGHEGAGVYRCPRCLVWVCWGCEGTDQNPLCDRCWSALDRSGIGAVEIGERYPCAAFEIAWPEPEPAKNDENPV